MAKTKRSNSIGSTRATPNAGRKFAQADEHDYRAAPIKGARPPSVPATRRGLPHFNWGEAEERLRQSSISGGCLASGDAFGQRSPVRIGERHSSPVCACGGDPDLDRGGSQCRNMVGTRGHGFAGTRIIFLLGIQQPFDSTLIGRIRRRNTGEMKRYETLPVA